MMRPVNRFLRLTALVAVCVVLAHLIAPTTFAEQARSWPGMPPGAGYRVANEAGIPFWDAFQAQGGMANLGYPLSRRYIAKDSVVQAFQFGVLRWNARDSVAEIQPVAVLSSPPADAKKAEPPLRL